MLFAVLNPAVHNVVCVCTLMSLKDSREDVSRRLEWKKFIFPGEARFNVAREAQEAQAPKASLASVVLLEVELEMTLQAQGRPEEQKSPLA